MRRTSSDTDQRKNVLFIPGKEDAGDPPHPLPWSTAPRSCSSRSPLVSLGYGGADHLYGPGIGSSSSALQSPGGRDRRPDAFGGGIFLTLVFCAGFSWRM
jgi:hypothetical protein